MDNIDLKLRIVGSGSDELLIFQTGVISIGRTDTNDITLPHHFVSTRHAQIEVLADAVVFTDLGSTNGSIVNNAVVAASIGVELQAGDVVIIGPFQLTLQPVAEEVVVVESAEIPSQAHPEENASAPPLLETMPDLVTQHSNRLRNYLPDEYHGDFMTRFMGIFEAMYTPMTWTIGNFDLFLSPNTAPSAFLPWIARWFEIEFDATWGDAQKRLFLSEAHRLFKLRGTRIGLSRLLEIYTGVAPDIIDLADDDDPFSFTVRLPIAAEAVNTDVVEQLIALNKPAHTTYKLFYRKA